MLLANLTVLAQEPNVWMPRFFADGMVLQRDEKIPLWGKGTPGYAVTVTLNEKKAKTTVQKDGTWKVYLPKMNAGGPYELVVTSKKGQDVATKEIRNVLIGDVFLCSGQSNMELPIRRCMDVVKNEVKDYSNPNIRYLKFPHQYNYVRPNDDVRTLPWQDITPQNCAEVSGICYFMARELQQRYKVPIGIINSAVGGTQVQAWMPRETLIQFDGYDKELAKQKYHQENWPDSIARMEGRAAMAWERLMMEKDTIVNRWRTEGYDFSTWALVDMFSDWSHGQNGSYWFRTTVTLPKSCAGQKAVLRFGAMKDADTIYVNGQYVGNTTYEYPPRVYNVKEGILREGENEVMVHLMSQSGRPNFTRGKLYQLEVGDQTFPLSQQLQMAVGSAMNRKPSSTYFVDTPTGLYNAMIAPLQDFPVKGMLWYQGESNLGNTSIYADLLTAMVSSWREQFKKEFPVVIMQLPGYMSKHDQPVETGWTQIRQQQMLAAERIPNAAIAPTLDTGEANDIHPQDKKTAGHRAALQMSRLAYGETSAAYAVPLPDSARVDAEARCIYISIKGSDILHKDGKLKGFSVRVGDKYEWAEASLQDGKTVKVALPAGVTATTVRYCWDDYPEPTLFNIYGVPVPQFQIEAE